MGRRVPWLQAVLLGVGAVASVAAIGANDLALALYHWSAANVAGQLVAADGLHSSPTHNPKVAQVYQGAGPSAMPVEDCKRDSSGQRRATIAWA